MTLVVDGPYKSTHQTNLDLPNLIRQIELPCSTYGIIGQNLSEKSCTQEFIFGNDGQTDTHTHATQYMPHHSAMDAYTIHEFGMKRKVCGSSLP